MSERETERDTERHKNAGGSGRKTEEFGWRGRVGFMWGPGHSREVRDDCQEDKNDRERNEEVDELISHSPEGADNGRRVGMDAHVEHQTGKAVDEEKKRYPVHRINGLRRRGMMHPEKYVYRAGNSKSLGPCVKIGEESSSSGRGERP